MFRVYNAIGQAWEDRDLMEKFLFDLSPFLEEEHGKRYSIIPVLQKVQGYSYRSCCRSLFQTLVTRAPHLSLVPFF
ncbi:unnamed protein product [Danaus chrysippus]|uniref:(African queen) hypothetical protein n=1 Tax=Danaus chrysippus TaxID=151541 RepID=A0A8J2VY53_9NEOP|nr:unnamed protein product [Danaus chrysippus]